MYIEDADQSMRSHRLVCVFVISTLCETRIVRDVVNTTIVDF